MRDKEANFIIYSNRGTCPSDPQFRLNVNYAHQMATLILLQRSSSLEVYIGTWPLILGVRKDYLQQLIMAFVSATVYTQ